MYIARCDHSLTLRLSRTFMCLFSIKYIQYIQIPTNLSLFTFISSPLSSLPHQQTNLVNLSLCPKFPHQVPYRTVPKPSSARFPSFLLSVCPRDIRCIHRVRLARSHHIPCSSTYLPIYPIYLSKAKQRQYQNQPLHNTSPFPSHMTGLNKCNTTSPYLYPASTSNTTNRSSQPLNTIYCLLRIRQFQVKVRMM